jgi:precorrin-8X/cobalt-precorrin-8 methylmutase
LERLGAGPDTIEARSRGIARELAAGRWQGIESELAAAVVYAGGDPSLLDSIAIRGQVPRSPARVLADVGMVWTGLRGVHTRAVAAEAPGAADLAQHTGTTRSAAGMRVLWEEFGRDGLVIVGNAPTALLAALDLATEARPAFVIATCPGFTLAEVAKSGLLESGLPHLAVLGTRGGSGLAAAAANVLLRQPG